jgi:hypothetical protein
MVRNKLILMLSMKTRRYSLILFCIMTLSVLYILSLAKLGISISFVNLMYLLFFETTIVFVLMVVIVRRNRAYKP